MRYLSLFSGIEAATAAWHPLGWECVAVAEIEPFPSAVLAHHYPGVRNLGDVTKLTEMDVADLGPIDLVVFGSPCFTAGHTVLTARGLVPIETVAVGDLVWTHASRWKRVSNVMTRTAPTVVVNGQGHNAIRATPDHPFYAAETIKTWNGNGYTRSIGTPEWVPADSMANKRWATPVNLTCDAEVPESLRSLDAAYLAGLYVGDGHIGRTTGRNKKSVILSVGFAKRDKMLPKLPVAWGTVSCMKHTQSVVRLQVSRTHIADAMLENFGELSHGKSIPVWALCASAEWQTAFLQGILDTDGSVKTSGYRVTTVSRALAVSLRLLCARLGYSTSLSFSERPKTCVIEGRTVNQRDTWEVALRAGNRTSEVRTDEHVWGLVRSVTPADDAQVFDITVEDDHSFICDGIVVHNCQDLSVAGKRKGLAGARSGLFFTAMQIITWSRLWCGTRFALWENVPGAFSSNKGADFAAVVDELSGLADSPVPPKGWGTEGCAAGPEAMVEWSTLDAQWFGVAQRRRRVFALADFGDWAGRQPILLEPQGMRGDSAPSREAGQGFTHSLAPSLTASGRGVERTGDTRGQDPVVAHSLRGEGFDASEDGTGRGTPLVPVATAIRTANTSANGHGVARVADPVEIARCLDSSGGYATNQGGNVVAQPVGVTIHGTDPTVQKVASYSELAQCLRARTPGNIDNSSTTVVQHPVSFAIQAGALRTNPNSGPDGVGVQADHAYTLEARAEVQAVAFHHNAQACQLPGPGRDTSVSDALTCSQQAAVAYTTKLHNTASNNAGSHSNGGGYQAVCVSLRGREGGGTAELGDEIGNCLRASSGGGDKPHVLTQMQVRRLTPVECERLMGFPDDHTLIPWRNKTADQCPDGPRYKSLGNSMAVPVMRWIGRRIDLALLFQE